MSTTTRTDLAQRDKDLKQRKADVTNRAKRAREELAELTDLSLERDLTAGENERFGRMLKAADRLSDELAEIREEELGIIREYARMPGHTQSGDGARVVDIPGTSKTATKFEYVHRGGDPWDGEVRGAGQSVLRDRALWACERSEHITDDGCRDRRHADQGSARRVQRRGSVGDRDVAPHVPERVREVSQAS